MRSALPTPIEVFYSYADPDEPLRTELDKHLSQLRRDGLITTWHKRQIIAGADWTKALDQHLGTPSVILLLISADFLASDYCYGIEMQQAMERYEAGEVRIIPILLRPVDWQSTPFGKLAVLPSNGRPVTSWSDRDDAFADVAQGIRATLQDLQGFAVSTPLPNFPRIWNIPYPRNPMFTGREEILSRVHTQLQAGQATAISQPQAISGLGGIGKTQIAAEYAYQYHQDYQAVFWTLADTRESLVSGYVALAELLNLPEKDERDQTKAIQAVIRWLSTHTAFLLILDNADDLVQVYEFLPPSFGGHLLLTTRAQATGTRASRIEVDIMPQEVGTLFFLRRAKLIAPDVSLEGADPVDIAKAREICEGLGGLPLALDQAGAYIEETGCSLSDYLDLFRLRQKDLLERRGVVLADHPQSVATTFSLAFEKIGQRNKAAIELLSLCSYFAPDVIPLELITQGATHLGTILGEVSADAFKLNQAMEILQAYSLVQRDRKRSTFRIHRLVQAVLKDGMNEETQDTWMQRAIQTMNEVFPEVEFKEWAKCGRYLPHVLVGMTWIKDELVPVPEAPYLLYRAGIYLQERGQYLEAEPILVRALTICELRLGSEHPYTVRSLTGLAVLYWYQGKYEQAEPLYQRALVINEQRLGPEHLGTAKSLTGLAVLYWYQGKYEQTEPLYQKALAICERQLGGEHPDTAKNLYGLAILYRDQGKYEQAEPLCKRALVISEQHLGPEHPDTAWCLYGLASVYLQQGKYEQAEPLYKRAVSISEQQQAISISERHLRTEHPDIAQCFQGLAELYHRQRKYEPAEAFYRRALAICEEHLGADHPHTAYPLHGLAVLSYHQGKYEQAEALYQRALAIGEQRLGAEHPLMARPLRGLAELYQHQEKHEQAEVLYQRALAIQEQRLGPTHPETQRTRRDYAAFLRLLGRNDEATMLDTSHKPPAEEGHGNEQ